MVKGLFCGLSKVYDNLTVVGGATGTVLADVSDNRFIDKLEDLGFYILYAFIGALVGWGVKALMELIGADKKLEYIKMRLALWDKENKNNLKSPKELRKSKDVAV